METAARIPRSSPSTPNSYKPSRPRGSSRMFRTIPCLQMVLAVVLAAGMGTAVAEGTSSPPNTSSTYLSVMTDGVLQPGFEQKRSCRIAPQGHADAGKQVCKDLVVHSATNTVLAMDGQWASLCKIDGTYARAASGGQSLAQNTKVVCRIPLASEVPHYRRSATTKQQAMQNYQQTRQALKEALQVEE